ncbi:glycoside hydrolase family 19 protein [Siculibacillus lacustris]|uniref:Glycoside hydrolase family 19 protein n=1 Tax=Siculibacillus lacustris TaxID=1549641 RepID=A0A4Q9VI24_9HYPH|nr:glycoside hydrolase family 19 protein [Siculibacillus lacustris]TBW34292.1 glycoside hydrolase family 19 protein [Siculibacillus lacustris]
MTVPITADQLRKLAPNARTNYLAAFATADADLAPFGINANKLRVAHFMAQVLHESGELTIFTENMNYSAPRLLEIFPSHFTPAQATAYAHKPREIAERAYGGRMGNGPEGSGDGWAFIGHGLLQITGRESYEKYGKVLGIPLATQPDLATSAQWSLKIAAAEWAASGYRGKSCNELADLDDIRGITRAINGGLNGFASRQEYYVLTSHVWP